MNRKILTDITIIALVTAVTSACVAPPQIVASNSACTWDHPIYLSDAAIKALSLVNHGDPAIAASAWYASLSPAMRAEIDLLAQPHPEVLDDRRNISSHNLSFEKICDQSGSKSG